MKRATVVLLAACLLWPSVSRATAVARDGQVVMGTVLEVTVVAGDEAAASSMVAAAIDEARRWDDALTIWRDDGELAQLNATAGQGGRTVSDRLRRGLEAMLEFSTATGGAFDPAVGSLGFAGAGARREQPLRGIREVLVLDGSRATLEAGSALDPGGVGKGLALDAMMALLRDRGANAAFVDFGGSSQAALGSPPGLDNGWGVVVTGLSGGTSHGRLHLHDEALSTSRSGARDTTPVLDPRSGEPVPRGRVATVRAAGAAAADAWSTALVVLGRAGLAAAQAAGVEALVEDSGGVAATPHLRASDRSGPGGSPAAAGQ